MNAVFKITGILLVAVLLFHGNAACGSNQYRQENPSQEEKAASSPMVKVEVEALNTDILKDRATSVIMNPENVIHMYIEVDPDGWINCEDFVLYPNEDYWMSLHYNDVKDAIEFHTGEDDGHYYILSIDYATGDAALRMIPEQGLLEAGDYTYYVNGDGTVVISGWKGADKEIVIPDEIDGRKVTTIGNWAFSHCEGLTSIKIPDSVTTIGDEAFSDCKGLTTIVIPDSVTSIGNQAFKRCSSLTSIELSDSLTTIGHEAFSDCSSLTSIELPDSLTTIERAAFESCSSLTRVRIPELVTTIEESTFFNCESLSCIELPDSLETINGVPFLCCDRLKRIEVSPDHEIFAVVDHVLFNKVEKTLMYYPEGLSGSEYIIPKGTEKIGMRAFNSADRLTNIEIPDSVTTIEEGAFLYCIGLESIEIPDSVTTIGESAFEECQYLKSIRIPDSVKKIGEKAFFCCYDLKSVEIPDSVTAIGSRAFDGCDHVTITVERDSYAERYAKENGIRYTYADENE